MMDAKTLAEQHPHMRDADMPIAERIKAATERIASGHASMRVPVEGTDPDIVLHDCRVLIERQAAELAALQSDIADALETITAQHSELAALRVENSSLKTVMVAAAEEIHAHWDAHCDAEGYGPQNLMRRLEEGIPSKYGYTAGAFAALLAERDALKADAERYRWLRGRVPGSTYRIMGVIYSEGGAGVDAAIDAARAGGGK